MRTVRLTLQYDGTNYAGWQVQENALTVQELVEKAVATIVKEEVRVAGASRTDSGVHALGQVAAFRTSSSVSTDKLLRSLNGILPHDIRVTEVSEAEEGFVPRFAREKLYRYAFGQGGVLSPFQLRYAWHVRERLDMEAMQAACAPLMGEHDFTSFTAAGGGEKSHTRTVYWMRIGEGGIVTTCAGDEGIYHIDICANGFLYKMVRNIVGTLVDVGRGKLMVADMARILGERDRRLAGPTAPAHGLCLVSVKY
ncbi:MAG: tRNA pseudouridine(38-40) synthase TruA [Candidatus Abyssubacteria bacterium]